MRLILLLAATFGVAGAHADTENVRKWQSQLQFREANASASGGATRRTVASEREAMFRHLDYDGDGFVSKAEAAGNSFATLGFDRADRNRDGKLSFAEYDSIGKPRATPKKQQQAKAGSASAGATKASGGAKAKKKD